MLKRHSMIPTVIVRIDGSSLGSALADEALKRFGVRGVHNGGAHVVRLAVLGTNNDRLANRAPTSLQFLVGVFVLFFPADVGFVYLDRAGEWRFTLGPGLADAVRQVPCRFLRYAQVAVKLHAGLALETGV